MKSRPTTTTSVTSSGLDSLANAYQATSGASTTIPVFDASTRTTKYNDNYNGAGDANSQLARWYSWSRRSAIMPLPPRPWRLAGVDIVPLSLRPALNTTPQSDSGSPSGHINAA